MGYSHSRPAPGVGNGAIHEHRPDARSTTVWPEHRDGNPKRPWAHAVIGARGDDLPRPQPTDDPHSADDKETTAIKALALIAKHWQLSDQQTASLLDTDVHDWQTLRDSVRPPSKPAGSAVTSSDLEHNSKNLHRSQRNVSRSSAVHRCAEGNSQHASLSKEQLTRISILFYMYISLQRLFTRDVAGRWVSCRNSSPAFGDRTPIDVMIEGGLPKIREARNYINAKMWG